MFNIKRNQVIITLLVFMIAIAAYLNSQDLTNATEGNEVAEHLITGDEPKAIEPAMVSQPIEQVAAVEEENLTMKDATSTETFTAVITKKDSLEEEDTASEASNTLDVSYFAEEKLLREQSRAEQIEQLSAYVDNENIDADSKAAAAANLLEIQERVEKESSAEALLRAKGFEEVYVRIDEDTVDVVVNKAELTETDIAQIEEIVNRKTGYSVGKINITPLRGIAKN